MRLLIGYSWGDVVIGVMSVSLVILVFVILYKRLLRAFSKGAISKEDYCELYSLEVDPAAGELPFYFTSSIERDVAILILDQNMDVLQEVSNEKCKVGGNIIRFDSSKLVNGNYFYCLKTENQKVVKKMRVLNA